MTTTEHYFLKYELDGPEVEVTREQWVRAERGAGFRPKGEDRGQPATGGFCSSGYGSWPSYISGSIRNLPDED